MAVIDEIGNTYGYLTVIERAQNNSAGRAMWKCRCKCGNEVVVLGKRLRSGATKSCGCYQKERAIWSNINRSENLVGQKIGKLTILDVAGFITLPNGKRSRLYNCHCDCGNYCQVLHPNLQQRETNSCGCITSIGNMKIDKKLKERNLNFKREYCFEDFICHSRPYRFDFALFDNENKLLGLIEYQGDIHFSARKQGWNTKESLQERQRRDKEKEEYCLKHNIKLFQICYFDDLEQKLEDILNELYGK